MHDYEPDFIVERGVDRGREDVSELHRDLVARISRDFRRVGFGVPARKGDFS